MKKALTSSILLTFSVLLGLLVALPVAALPNLILAEVNPPGQLVQVPQVAIDQSPAIVPLGSAVLGLVWVVVFSLIAGWLFATLYNYLLKKV